MTPSVSGGPPGDVTFVAAVLYTDAAIAHAVGIAQIVEKNNPTLPGAT